MRSPLLPAAIGGEIFHITAPVFDFPVIGEKRLRRATGLTAITPEIETRQIRRARERAEKKEARNA